jgi:hypothetical protein
MAIMNHLRLEGELQGDVCVFSVLVTRVGAALAPLARGWCPFFS